MTLVIVRSLGVRRCMDRVVTNVMGIWEGFLCLGMKESFN